MERLAIFAHGFKVSDKGKATTDKLIPFFNSHGYHCYEKDTTKRLFLGVRFGTPRYAKEVAEYTNRIRKCYPKIHIVFIGHSDGCNMGNQAAHAGASFDQAVYINPALDNDAELAEQVKQCLVFHNENDIPVQLAKRLPFHPWGDMGAVGYMGNDSRYKNYNTLKAPVPYGGHSGMFKDKEVTKYFGNFITDLVGDFKDV